MPAASASGAIVFQCWRASSSVGAIRAACRPTSITAAQASSATTVLPEPTSPWSRRDMRSGLARSAAISAIGPLLRACQFVGQGGDDLLAQAPVAGRATPARPAHMGAHQPKRELAGQEFVIGETRPRGCLGGDLGGGRTMYLAQRIGEWGKLDLREPAPRPAIQGAWASAPAPARSRGAPDCWRALRSAGTAARSAAVCRTPPRRRRDPGAPSAACRHRAPVVPDTMRRAPSGKSLSR